VLNPISPCPLYTYAPGKYFLIFNHNDGYAFGSKGPTDYQKNRRPTFITTGEFDPNSNSCRRFANPKNSESKNVQTSSHGEIKSKIAAAPATARIKNPNPITNTSKFANLRATDA
jgi:hypothetical protein